MAKTQGQLEAEQYAQMIAGTTWQDWVPDAGSNSGYSNAALMDSQVSWMMNAPEGTFTAEQIRTAANAVDQRMATGGAQAVGTQALADKQAEAAQAIKWWDENPNGHEHNSLLDRFMTNIFPAVIVGAFAVAAGGAIGSAMGSGGGGAAAAGSAGSGAAGTAAGVGTAGTAGGTAAVGGTLGTTIGASGIPQVIISGAAPAAGAGLGTVGAGAALGGLGAIAAGGGAAPPPNYGDMQTVEIPRPATPDPALGAAELGAGLGAGIGLGNMPIDNAALENLPDFEATPDMQQVVIPPPVTPSPGTFDNLPIPVLPLPNVTNPNGTGTTPTTGGFPSLEDLIKGLVPILGGAHAKQKAEEDSAWWKSQIDELQGMYKPGTLEAEQMRQKMEARDAAAGRRSQYGIREVNLASNLAEKRAGIMTSAGYQNMANAYRNRDSQSLNSLFAAAGDSNTQNMVSGLISGIGGLFK